MTAQMQIKIEFSQDGLFGAADPDTAGYNVADSMDRFGEELEAFVYEAYPGADIEIVQSINDSITVDCQADHDEVARIEQLVERVWNDQPWEVRA
jgi:hypothetical protein